MNQKLRQNSNNDIEKYFFKLLNISNFGHNCSFNLDNWLFEPICNELEKVTYIKKSI